ncbi:MAG: tRNA (N6-threonylcarbamoyladenosine(37)-N6)-methyltransferase TrmO [Bacteroidaceae bacterium]|nr:tRNA (N6-threonylcarbamoyladenosine(37)-N6)-methyltransferase TrmO [Bacteroidaceae bacterium]
MEIKPIAHIETDFPTKFGVPRQSGLVKGLKGRIVFEKEYRDPEALRGLEGFSHIWLLWDFSEARREDAKWQPTVRPPRLGGNKRMGVFATRSPFRPNNIGLSSVRIVGIDLHTSEGPVIEVEGADLMDGTPIFDIKPYLPFTDSHPDAKGGFAERTAESQITTVHLSAELLSAFDEEHIEALREVLLSDPRPHYHDDAERIYAMEFAGEEVKFRVKEDAIEVWLECNKTE